MRWVIGAAIVVGLALGLSQVIIPNVAQNKIEDRLTQDGGTADVHVSAIPAVRLLFGDGDKLTVDARRIDIPVTEAGKVSFKDLDKFDEVDITLLNSFVGPVNATRIELNRGEGDAFYSFTFRGNTSPTQLADFVLDALPAGLRAIAEAIGGRPSGGSIPVRMDATLKSENGQARLVRGSGDIAGLPLGPFALGIASAVINRLTG
jgi:hypothetical protein